MNGLDTVLVPIARPPSYAPAWGEKPPGIRVSRTLDLGDVLADAGHSLADVSVELEPPLVADTFDVAPSAINFFLSDAPPAAPQTRWRVRFRLRYSGGGQDEIVVYQPIGAAPPIGLIATDPSANTLSVGGQVVTIGSVSIRV